MGLVVSGTLQEAVHYSAMVTITASHDQLYIKQHVEEVYGLAMIFSLTGYLGVNCVLVLLKCSGALTTVTGMDHVSSTSHDTPFIPLVTTFRKALSIVISFLFFTKPFTIQ